MNDGERFHFGDNWRRFLDVVSDERIAAAEGSLRDMLKLNDLIGCRFLDVGCGSGLFSLAARRMGATVHSFDYDPLSAACAAELRHRFQGEDPEWKIEQGSALDRSYLEGLGTFDVVYAWGVLHHTGDMWQAMENVADLVRSGGRLYLALYNDQGAVSDVWTSVKRRYTTGGKLTRALLLASVAVTVWTPPTVRDALRGAPLRAWRQYGSENRGMSRWRDLVDWVGGYPFEVAKPGDVVDFYHRQGFSLERLRTTNRLGCNEFVFVRWPTRSRGRRG